MMVTDQEGIKLMYLGKSNRRSFLGQDSSSFGIFWSKGLQTEHYDHIDNFK